MVTQSLVSGAARTPRPQDRSYARLGALEQALFMAGLLIVTWVMSLVGLGSVARIVYMLTGVAAGAYYAKRSPWLFLTLTFWFWTITPFARRIIDLYAGFDLVNILLGTPNLIVLLMLRDVIASRDMLRQREAIIGFLVLIPILYGLAVSFVVGDVVPGATAAADWVAPVLYYFYILVHWRRIGEADRIIREFLGINLLVVALYCIYQYVNPPPWDVVWILNSGLHGLSPNPFEIRIFGTLNSPGLLAIWLGVSLILFLHFRTRLSAVLSPICLVLLFMTLSRSVAGGVALGFLIAGLMGLPGIFRVLGVATIATVLVVAIVSATVPDLTDSLTTRFDSVQDLGNDTSALERTALYRSAPNWIDAHPMGMGIGALGRGAIAGANESLVVVDSGPISIYLSLGWVFGSVYLGGIALVMAQSVLAARASRSPAAIVLAAAAVSNAALLPFFNVTGLVGVALWFCAGYAAALAVAAREQVRPAAVPVSRQLRPAL